MKNISSRILLLTACLFFGLSAYAGNEFTIEPIHSSPVVEFTHQGISVQKGYFSKMTGKMNVDAKHKTGSLQFTIDASLLDINKSEMEKQLKGIDGFDVAKYPTITFISDRIVYKKSVPVSADGELTIKSVKKKVSLQIDNFKCMLAHSAISCGMEISSILKLSDFGMNGVSSVLGDEFKLYSSIRTLNGLVEFRQE